MNNRPSGVMPLMKDQMIARQLDAQNWCLPAWGPGAYRHRKPDKTRLHRAPLIVALSSSAFFSSRPALLRPLLEGFFIPLRGALDGLLPTPARLAQQSPNVIAVITHPRSVRSVTTATRLAVHTSPRKP